MNKPIIEICTGSVTDCLVAYKCGIKRVELNSAIYLGGLTPTITALKMVKDKCKGLEICSMVRPRGAGFCYSDTEYEQMLNEAKELVAHESDGIVFGILNPDSTMDIERLKPLIHIAHSFNKTAVIHRAFDCVKNQEAAIEDLIKIGVDRVLTSGGAENAVEGIESLAHLQKNYGNEIEILAGCGIRPSNVKEIIEKTGVKQVHSSCGSWYEDVTTSGNMVSYGYAPSHPLEYEGCDEILVKEMIDAIKD